MGILGSVLSILIEFPSNLSQHVIVDSCRSKLVNIVSEVPQGSVLGTLMFLLYTSELFSILENKLLGYADEFTLIAVVPCPGVRVAVTEFLHREVVKAGLNASKTKTMIVSRSRTMHPLILLLLK